MNYNKKMSTKMLAEAGIMLALAVVLGQIKLFSFPQGGSITLGSMVPIILFSVRWGGLNGFILGFLYGLIKILLGGYVIGIVQGAMDYPIAYAMIGLSGIAIGKDKEQISTYLPSIIIAHILRAASHIAAGVIFFKEYAPEGISPIKHSVGYNFAFMGPELVLSIFIITLLWQPLVNNWSKSK